MAIRIIFQTNAAGAFETLQAATDWVRRQPGCAHAETFRSVEFPENLLHIQLWDSPPAWDAAWAKLRDTETLVLLWRSVAAPFQVGYAGVPRGTGQNGIEFYKYSQFIPTGPSWVAAGEHAPADSIRWPALGPIRILIQVAADPAMPAEPLIQNSIETRAEAGCLHFEYFRSIDYEENLSLIESWASPRIYDVHWMNRLLQNPPPPPPSPKRRYGETNFEWYAQCPYALTGEVWMPEAVEQRMVTVRW